MTDTRQAQTYIDFYGDEKADRRKQSRDGQDQRVDHLFNGFDNVIENADGYTKGYVQAMRKEFAELIAALTAPPVAGAAPAPEPSAQAVHPESMRGLVEGAGGHYLTGGGAAFTSIALAKFVVDVVLAASPQPQPSAQGEPVGDKEGREQ